MGDFAVAVAAGRLGDVAGSRRGTVVVARAVGDVEVVACGVGCGLFWWSSKIGGWWGQLWRGMAMVAEINWVNRALVV